MPSSATVLIRIIAEVHTNTCWTFYCTHIVVRCAPCGRLSTRFSRLTEKRRNDNEVLLVMNNNNNSIQFLSICMLTQQSKGQLQSEHERKKQTHIKYKDKAIYNICVMMMIKIIMTTEIKVIS
jgi:hypothetical protein